MVMLLLVTLPMSPAGRRLGRPRWLCPEKIFLGKIEYNSGKALPNLPLHCAQLFFYLQHPIIELPSMQLHNISCIESGCILCTTISTLPQRYRTCKYEPI